MTTDKWPDLRKAAEENSDYQVFLDVATNKHWPYTEMYSGLVLIALEKHTTVTASSEFTIKTKFGVFEGPTTTHAAASALLAYYEQLEADN